MTRGYALTLQLRDDPAAIERYRAEHRAAWPEVVRALRAVGVERMRIFLLGRRLFMWLEVEEGFDRERDFARLAEAPRYREWDELMRTLQEPVAEAREGEWWAELEEVFDLDWPQFRELG